MKDSTAYPMEIRIRKVRIVEHVIYFYSGILRKISEMVLKK